MTLFLSKKKKSQIARQKEAERQSKIDDSEDVFVDETGEKVYDNIEPNQIPEEIGIISLNSKQYKALVTRLEKYDNEKTDAVRMALLYLESGGDITIDQFEKFIS